MTQGLEGHHWSKSGAADADVDDIADALAGVAEALTAAHVVCERSHALKHGLNFGDDIDAVDDNALLRRRAQCGR